MAEQLTKLKDSFCIEFKRPKKRVSKRPLLSEGCKTLQVQTCDMNSFETDQTFDRVVSVEMFEHMKNYDELLRRINKWLNSEEIVVHIFSHNKFAYLFETRELIGWDAIFFTGGIMPSDDLLSHFGDLTIEKQWQVNGIHYSKTAEAWLTSMDLHETEIEKFSKKLTVQTKQLNSSPTGGFFYGLC